ncbi:hypothetical protein K2173_021223 [Erythroxylum novogranatense]|uniref:Hyccin n=1 Tax=Erythroxylum novogranatense TaxID=1862640 RepID=A0AAV8TNE6_9ROSI|nr:hypothetical protein K2173_021223 [Erythroxylum novogranatense]
MDLTTTINNSPSPTSSNSSNHRPTITPDPMQSWWESISKARSRILSLSSLLPSHPSSSFALSSLADSDRPALSFLASHDAYYLLSSALSSPSSGSGSDPLCQWLYDTYLSSDSHLRLIVLSFLPLLAGLYLSRVHSSGSASTPSLAGFEAVLLAIYSSEAKSRAGKPVLVQVPDLSQPSLYHAPRNRQNRSGFDKSQPSVGVMCPPLEPQVVVKSTKRPIIVGVTLDCYFKQISQMPSWSKVELCKYAASWAGQDCDCTKKFDDVNQNEDVHVEFSMEDRSLSNGYDEIGDEIEVEHVVGEMGKLGIERNEIESEISSSKGVRIPLPWEILQPLLRILGHCLLGPLNAQDVKDSASLAVRRLYARGSHDLVPQAILATRSLIQLDKRAREAAKAAALASANSANASSNANTPSKAKKPEILLVSK